MLTVCFGIAQATIAVRMLQTLAYTPFDFSIVEVTQIAQLPALQPSTRPPISERVRMPGTSTFCSVAMVIIHASICDRIRRSKYEPWIVRSLKGLGSNARRSVFRFKIEFCGPPGCEGVSVVHSNVV